MRRARAVDASSTPRRARAMPRRTARDASFFDAKPQQRARLAVNKCLVFQHNTPIIQSIGSTHMLVWEDDLRSPQNSLPTSLVPSDRDGRVGSPSLRDVQSAPVLTQAVDSRAVPHSEP